MSTSRSPTMPVKNITALKLGWRMLTSCFFCYEVGMVAPCQISETYQFWSPIVKRSLKALWQWLNFSFKSPLCVEGERKPKKRVDRQKNISFWNVILWASDYLWQSGSPPWNHNLLLGLSISSGVGFELSLLMEPILSHGWACLALKVLSCPGDLIVWVITKLLLVISWAPKVVLAKVDPLPIPCFQK